MGRYAQMFEHMDVDTPGFSVFIERALNYIMTEVFNTELPPLKGRSFVPTRSTTPVGALSVSFKRYTRAGIAQWITTYGQDLPSVSMWVSEETHKIFPMGAAYKYTIFDLMAAQMANSPQ